MSNLQDIREWGRQNGYDVPDKGRLPTGLRTAYESQPIDAVPTTDSDGNVVERTPETPPRVDIEPPITSKARKLFQSGSVKKTGPKKRQPRVAVDRLIERGWEMMARMVQPVNLPVARVLAMQAPVAGLLLEDEIKGTVVDRFLQPIARTEKKGEVAFALIGPPLLVGLLTGKPELAPVVVPVLRESLAVWITVAGPKLEVQAKRNAEFEAKFGVQIDMLLQQFLGPIYDEESTDTETQNAA